MIHNFHLCRLPEWQVSNNVTRSKYLIIPLLDESFLRDINRSLIATVQTHWSYYSLELSHRSIYLHVILFPHTLIPYGVEIFPRGTQGPIYMYTWWYTDDLASRVNQQQWYQSSIRGILRSQHQQSQFSYINIPHYVSSSMPRYDDKSKGCSYQHISTKCVLFKVTRGDPLHQPYENARYLY